MITGGCHCGAIHVEIDRLPDYINLCDCSLCLKSGGAWGYFESHEVSWSGSVMTYRRYDREAPAVELCFCMQCGTTTHWELTEHHPGERIGVNMRIFEPKDIEGIETRTLDGRHWSGEGEAQHRRSAGKLGDDVFL